MRGYHVGGLPAVGDDAVHHLARLKVLAQQTDRDLSHRGRIGRIEPQVGCNCRVTGPSNEVHRNFGERQGPGASDVARTGMRHDGCRDVVERACLEHQRFAATRFLGGRAE